MFMNKTVIVLLTVLFIAGCTQTTNTSDNNMPIVNETINETTPESVTPDIESVMNIQDNNVTITNARFSPESITISLGDNIAWTNNDATSYIIRQEGNIMYTKNITEGERYTFNYINVGNFTYYLRDYPEEKLLVIVTE